MFGFSFAVLWICMARGSKYMYERLEHGIDKAYGADSGFLDKGLSNTISDEFYECLWDSGDYTYIPRHGALPMSDHNYRIFSTKGSRFSSSKVNIMIGYFLLIAWLILAMMNPVIIENDCCNIVVYVVGVIVFLSALIGFGIKFKFRILFLIVMLLMSIAAGIGIVIWKLPILGVVITIIAEFILFVIICRCCLSEYRLSLFDYCSLLSDNIDSTAEGDKKQFKFVADLEDNVPSYISSHVSSVMQDYMEHCDNSLSRSIVRRYLKEHDKGSVRMLLNDEELRNVFETALMYRGHFNNEFLGEWEDAGRNLRVIIRPFGVVIRLNRRDKPSPEEIVLPVNGETRLFADTRWDVIRRGDEYRPGRDDRRMHLIYNEMNGLTVYVKFSLETSLSDRIYYCDDESPKMSVDLTIKNPGDVFFRPVIESPEARTYNSFSVVRRLD